MMRVDARGEQDLRDGDAGRAEPDDSTRRSSRRRPVILTALSSAASTTTAVPCWSSWKTGMSSERAQPLLDLEAARRRDVLEVDAAEAGRDRLDGRDDRVRVLGVEADGKRVDAGELLEEHALALHHRHRGLGADVAQAEHGGAVRDDRDRVALDRVLEGLVAVVVDRHADARDARRVRHREVVAGLERDACCAARSCRRCACAGCGRWRRPRSRRRRSSIASTICAGRARRPRCRR